MWSSGWRIRHTCITCIAMSKTDPKRKSSHTIRSRCARVWIVVDEMETPFVWSLSISLYINCLESMAIFFLWTFMCPFFSLFFSILGPSCVHIFFDSPCLSSFFNKNWREGPTHIEEHLFCGMSGWYNPNFSKKHSKGVYGVHVNLDHESMKRILSGVTTI